MTLSLWPADGPLERPSGSPGQGAAPTPATQERTEPRRVTLARLAGEIARSLASIGRVAVEGEVHRPQTSRSGWTYFTLKDRAAQLSVSVPARAARRCRAVNGERVMVVGLLVWLNDRGQLVMEAEEVMPIGEGAVAAMIAETRARLAAEGLLGRPRRPLPLLPRAIGVLCGAEAAVRRDIESVVAVRFPGYPLAVEETTVSGPGAALSIMEGLARLARREDVDVIVLARGGGDATALLPWSDEEVCRAVAACPVPVVSAIGHESDRPLCDEVADLRCGTPSIAAHHVVPDKDALRGHIGSCLSTAARSMLAHHQLVRQRLDRVQVKGALAAGSRRAHERLDHAGARMAWVFPATGVAAGRRRLESCQWRSPLLSRLDGGHRHLGSLSLRAQALSPQHVVERGFAVVRRLDGSIVRSPSEVMAGEEVELTVARGTIAAAVLAKGGAGAGPGGAAMGAGAGPRVGMGDDTAPGPGGRS